MGVAKKRVKIREQNMASNIHPRYWSKVQDSTLTFALTENENGIP